MNVKSERYVHDYGRRKPQASEPRRQITEFDRERIARAEAKRARKAARHVASAAMRGAG